MQPGDRLRAIFCAQYASLTALRGPLHVNDTLLSGKNPLSAKALGVLARPPPLLASMEGICTQSTTVWYKLCSPGHFVDGPATHLCIQGVEVNTGGDIVTVRALREHKVDTPER